MQSQQKRNVIKITEMRDGCIWKTKIVCQIWVNIDDPRLMSDDLSVRLAREKEIAESHGGDQLGSLNTDEMRKGYDYCYRTVADNSPEYI